MRPPTTRCPGCGAQFADIDGPTHRWGLREKEANAAMIGLGEHEGAFAWLEPPAALGAMVKAA